MRYPKKLNSHGYYNGLMEQYRKKYTASIGEKLMSSTISFIIQRISSIIEKSEEDSELLDKTREFLLRIDKLAKENLISLFGAVKPREYVGLIFWAAQKSEAVISVIENNMKISVPPTIKDNYLEFLKEIAIQVSHELSAANEPKSSASKKVHFGNVTSSATVGEFEKKESLEKHEELEEQEKLRWLSKTKESSNGQSKEQKELQALNNAVEIVKENINSNKP